MANYCLKLTDANHETHYGAAKWIPGRWNPNGLRPGGQLCSAGFYHAYEARHPWLPFILNRVHANIYQPVLWLAEYRGEVAVDGALKFGATQMRVLKRLRVQQPQHAELVRFSALCLLQLQSTAVAHEWLEALLAQPDCLTISSFVSRAQLGVAGRSVLGVPYPILDPCDPLRVYLANAYLGRAHAVAEDIGERFSRTYALDIFEHAATWAQAQGA